MPWGEQCQLDQSYEIRAFWLKTKGLLKRLCYRQIYNCFPEQQYQLLHLEYVLHGPRVHWSLGVRGGTHANFFVCVHPQAVNCAVQDRADVKAARSGRVLKQEYGGSTRSCTTISLNPFFLLGPVYSVASCWCELHITLQNAAAARLWDSQGMQQVSARGACSDRGESGKGCQRQNWGLRWHEIWARRRWIWVQVRVPAQECSKLRERLCTCPIVAMTRQPPSSQHHKGKDHTSSCITKTWWMRKVSLHLCSILASLASLSGRTLSTFLGVMFCILQGKSLRDNEQASWLWMHQQRRRPPSNRIRFDAVANPGSLRFPCSLHGYFEASWFAGLAHHTMYGDMLLYAPVLQRGIASSWYRLNSPGSWGTMCWQAWSRHHR